MKKLLNTETPAAKDKKLSKSLLKVVQNESIINSYQS